MGPRARTRRAGGQVQRADQQAGHDLVAHAQQQRGVEHVVVSAMAVAIAMTSRENRLSSMPGRPCGDAVAHGRHATGHLGRWRRSGAPRLDQVG